MVALTTPKVNKDWIAPAFNLLGVDGLYHSLEELKGKNGTVVVFMCNHCPYVKSIIDKIIMDAKELQNLGVNFIAINANDSAQYPEDSYEMMKEWSKKYKFPFLYLIDDTQQIARQYGAVCTPDFFGFNAVLKLQYRGRFDSSQKNTATDAEHELFIAMAEISKTGTFNGMQHPSIGCSIKWKEERSDPL